MAVIYADGIFLINTLVDYLIILITGRIAGIPLLRKRFFFAALLGGLYGAAAVVPGLNALLSIPVKFLIWMLMALTAYGFSRNWIKLTLLSGIVSCALAGTVFAAGFLLKRNPMMNPCFLPETCRVLLLCGVCGCILCTALFQTCIHSKIEGLTIPLEVSIGGKCLPLTALLDTGNQLRDPATGQPILVVSPDALRSVLPPQLSELLSSDRLERASDLPEQIRVTAPELCPRLIFYRALGVPSGMLLTVRADWIRVNNTVYPQASVAIAPFDLGLGYSALWGGTLKGESITHDLLE